MTIPPEMTAKFQERMGEYTRTLDCVHCGLCIPYCPTYDLTLRESDAPRGRIYLMRQYAEGSMELSDAVKKHLDQCIVCRGCETVCPSGIQMGEMIESFREEVHSRFPNGSIGARVGRLLLRQVLPHRGRIGLLTDLIYLYQLFGLDRLAKFVVRRILRSPRLEYLQRLQPTIQPHAQRRIETDATLPEGYAANGTARMRVGLFLGCITSHWFARTHKATIRVLQANGCDVVVPERQTCCGALHRHSGLVDEGKSLFEQNAAAFKESGVDVVVVNAAGCGAALKESPHGANEFGVPVRDICEFLDEVGITPPTGRIEQRVAYDQPCHLLHGQKIAGSVVEGLLPSIPGLQLVDLPSSDKCCGSGGVYSLLEPEMAKSIGDEKGEMIRKTNADIVVTGNPGCAMQIRAALADSEMEVLHPIELLDRAYSSAD